MIPVPVQATSLPARNNSSQYQARTMLKEESLILQRDPKYIAFLERVRGDVLRCMLQNSIFDICADDFARMQEEEAIKGHRSDKPINEIMSCMDIRHCKDMQVSVLRWHPQLQRLQGVHSLLLIHVHLAIIFYRAGTHTCSASCTHFRPSTFNV
jgi:hypothetical protein